MIPEHAQVLFKEFAFSCVAHAGQVSALCFPTVNFCFRPREHFVLKENELIYVATAVKLWKKIVMRTRNEPIITTSSIFFFFLRNCWLSHRVNLGSMFPFSYATS